MVKNIFVDIVYNAFQLKSIRISCKKLSRKNQTNHTKSVLLPEENEYANFQN